MSEVRVDFCLGSVHIFLTKFTSFNTSILAPWYHSTTVAWCNDSTVLWLNCTTARCHHGTLLSWYHATVLSRLHDTIVPWHHAIMESWHQALWHHANSHQWDHGTMIPRYHAGPSFWDAQAARVKANNVTRITRVVAHLAVKEESTAKVTRT